LDKAGASFSVVSDHSDFNIQNSKFLRLSSFRSISIMLKSEFRILNVVSRRVKRHAAAVAATGLTPRAAD